MLLLFLGHSARSGLPSPRFLASTGSWYGSKMFGEVNIRLAHLLSNLFPPSTASRTMACRASVPSPCPVRLQRFRTASRIFQNTQSHTTVRPFVTLRPATLLPHGQYCRQWTTLSIRNNAAGHRYTNGLIFSTRPSTVQESVRRDRE